MKIWLDELNGRYEMAKEAITEFEDRAIEIMPSKGKSWKKINSFRNLWNVIITQSDM